MIVAELLARMRADVSQFVPPVLSAEAAVTSLTGATTAAAGAAGALEGSTSSTAAALSAEAGALESSAAAAGASTATHEALAVASGEAASTEGVLAASSAAAGAATSELEGSTVGAAGALATEASAAGTVAATSAVATGATEALSAATAQGAAATDQLTSSAEGAASAVQSETDAISGLSAATQAQANITGSAGATVATAALQATEGTNSQVRAMEDAAVAAKQEENSLRGLTAMLATADREANTFGVVSSGAFFRVQRGLAGIKTLSGEAGSGYFGLSGAATAALGVAAVATLGFVKLSVDALREHQAAMEEFEAVASRVPSLAHTNADAFYAQATALQNLTGRQNEEIIAGDAVLARFRLNQQQIERLIPLVVDFAQVTGQDVPAAALGVGRALIGNSRALMQLGIRFQATGDTAQDFETLMGLLENRVAGAGERFGHTFPGQLAIFKAELKDVEETAGGAVMPTLTELMRGLRDLVPVVALVGRGLAIATPIVLRFGTAWLVFKAVTFVPVVLEAVAGAMAGVAFQGELLGPVLATDAAGFFAVSAAAGTSSKALVAWRSITSTVVGRLGILGAVLYSLRGQLKDLFVTNAPWHDFSDELSRSMHIPKQVTDEMYRQFSNISVALGSGPSEKMTHAGQVWTQTMREAARAGIPVVLIQRAQNEGWRTAVEALGGLHGGFDQFQSALRSMYGLMDDGKTVTAGMQQRILSLTGASALFAYQMANTDRMTLGAKVQIAAMMGQLDQMGGSLSRSDRQLLENAITVGDVATAMDVLHDAERRVFNATLAGQDSLDQMHREMGMLRGAAIVLGESFGDFATQALDAWNTTQEAQQQVMAGAKPDPQALAAWDTFVADTTAKVDQWRDQLAKDFNFVANSLGDVAQKMQSRGSLIADALSGTDKFTVGNVLNALNDATKAAKAYDANWSTVARRAGRSSALVMSSIQNLGDDGGRVLARLAGASDKDFDRIVDAMKRTADAGQGTAQDIIRSFDLQLDKMNTYRRDWKTVTDRASGSARDLLIHIANMGEEGAGLLHALAGANDREFDAIVGKWNRAGGMSNSLASTIEEKLVGSITDLTNAIKGLPGWKDITINTKINRTPFDDFLADVRAHSAMSISLALNLYRANASDLGGSGSHTGGLVGLDTPRPIYHTGGEVSGAHGGAERGVAAFHVGGHARFAPFRPGEVPAVLKQGEFVVRDEMVKVIGLRALRRLNAGDVEGAIDELRRRRRIHSIATGAAGIGRMHAGGVVGAVPTSMPSRNAPVIVIDRQPRKDEDITLKVVDFQIRDWERGMGTIRAKIVREITDDKRYAADTARMSRPGS